MLRIHEQALPHEWMRIPALTGGMMPGRVGIAGNGLRLRLKDWLRGNSEKIHMADLQHALAKRFR